MPALPRTHPRRRALLASGARVTKADSPTRRRLGEEWQRRALTYCDLVPELNFASRFYARMLTRVRMFPARRLPDDSLEPIEDGLPLELLDRIQDPGGGRSQLQYQYGRLMMVTGEGNLFGRDLNSDDEAWAFVWNDEVEVDDQNKVTWRPTGDGNATGKTYSPSKGVIYRMWTPHAAASGRADSPMHSILDIAEELVILTKGVRATAVSRMVNGILKVPSELSFGPAEAGSDDDPEANPFLRSMIDHITGAIENAGTAEAAAPFIAEASAEYLKELVWMSTHDSSTDYMERELRKEAVTRLSYGLDMPPEDLTGLADSNHWTGKQITHDRWRIHGAPVAERMCDDFCEAYLRPALRKEKHDGWEEIVIGFDDSKVVTSPDMSEDADKAHDRGAIGYSGYRKLKGIPDDMAPTPEEHEEWLAIKMRAPQALGEEFLPPGQRGPARNPEDDTDADEGPPEPAPGRDVSREESRAAAERVVGAAEFALLRCREVAGARIRSKQTKNPSIFSNVNGQPNAVVAALVGQEGLAALDVGSPLELVSGGSDGFKVLLLSWGYSIAQAEALAEMLTVFAARTLFETLPVLPASFTTQVERTRELTHVQ